jgi:hypothetical protein
MAIKRLNYFDHQFLVEADFTAQQNYHLNMRRHLNRVLHTFGIAEGLEVAKTASRSVTVKPGTAIDRDGRETLLEAARVIDLDATQFPAGTFVFITAAYRETPSDPSTATGVAGNTRVTEEAIISAVKVAPPTDGTVIRLATFRMDDGANVPGNINDSLDGGVRQRVGVKGIEQGLVSLDGVGNPGGNIDLVAPAGQSIVITPDDANNRITIAESHSARTGNPHQTTAADIGALLAKDYDLGRRALATFSFNQDNKDQTPASFNLPFQPKVIVVNGIISAALGTRTYSGGVSAFAFVDTATGVLVQRCFGFGVTRRSDTDWFARAVTNNTILASIIQDLSLTPPVGENFSVLLTSLTPTGLVAVLNRTLVTGVPAPVAVDKFTIGLHLMCMG